MQIREIANRQFHCPYLLFLPTLKKFVYFVFRTIFLILNCGKRTSILLRVYSNQSNRIIYVENLTLIVFQCEIPSLFITFKQVSSTKIGSILSLPIINSWKDIIKVHLKGKEHAHIVYAKDVANVALFLLVNNIPGVNIYFVSCDDDVNNTVAGIYNLYQSLCHKKNHIRFTLPNEFARLLDKN